MKPGNHSCCGERRYNLSSLAADAKELNRVIHRHWSIENFLHRVLDIACREDDSRIRKDHAPENMMKVRHAALNLLKLLDHRFDLLTGRCTAETEPNRAHPDLRCHSHSSQNWGHLD